MTNASGTQTKKYSQMHIWSKDAILTQRGHFYKLFTFKYAVSQECILLEFTFIQVRVYFYKLSQWTTEVS